ncbi:MAG: hypothetical protein OR995_05885 [Candidatus Nanopelagicales bacterium]|jgi:thiaminase/transcriptional activator TenA|nr:hypothetical protein [Candidatus Nanopelagicales bacterium]
MRGRFDEFTTGASDIWSAYLQHPFMLGVHDGTLTRNQFTFFLEQDMPYQRDFLNALLLTATKQIDPEALLRMRGFIAEEVDFEISLLSELGVEWSFDRWAAGPAREGYMNHLMRVAHEGSLGDVYASLLPCAAGFTGAMAEPTAKDGLPPTYQRWLEFYERPEQFTFSSELVERFEEAMTDATSTDLEHARSMFGWQILSKRILESHVIEDLNPYRWWFETYGADDALDGHVTSLLELLDELAEKVSPDRREQLRTHFLRSEYFETKAWDAYFTMESWPKN